MAIVKPFICLRPETSVVSKVAALPYDVYSRAEAKAEVKREPFSFLKIDRAETGFSDKVDTYDARVYKRARKLLDEMTANGIFVREKIPCYYVYELTMDGRSQTGIVGCASVDDYVSGVIRKHENTREDKEQDRICHVDVTGAHTGPIFLAYRSDPELNGLVGQVCSQECLYDFTAEDKVRHRVWQVTDKDLVAGISRCFGRIPSLYIADGHHRAASAVKVGLKRRAENPGYTGEEAFNSFLSVVFPDDQLMIMPYNRVVKDLNGLGKEAFLERVSQSFSVEKRGKEACQPDTPRHVGMYLDGEWYELSAKAGICPNDPVKGLDVSILQDALLAPVLGIQDPRTDARIQFVGGIRGLGELERLVDTGQGAVAFSMYPTSIQELFAVADAGLLMPPKSTWFEPKLRSGLFIHRL